MPATGKTQFNVVHGSTPFHAPTLQRHELWALHGNWVRDSQPKFGPGTAERFQAASQITQEQVDLIQ